MIMVTSPSKPFSRTAKGTTRRPAILLDYETEIEDLYKVVEESAQTDLPPPTDWSSENSLEFIRAAVNKVLPGVEDSDDIFQRGCDRSVAENMSEVYELKFVHIAYKRRGSVTRSCMHFGVALALQSVA